MTHDKKCPICGKPVLASTSRPFCSDRCRKMDLNRWLSDVYRIPGSDEPVPPEPANDDQG